MRFKQLAVASSLALTALGASAMDVAVPSTESFAALVSKGFNNEYDFSLAMDTTLTSVFTTTAGISVSEYLYSVDYDTGVITELSWMKLGLGKTTLVTPILAGDYFYKLVGKATSGGSYMLDLSVPDAPPGVPEPDNVGLLLAGVGMLALVSRRSAR
jgi:hypothetical protein